MACLFKRLLGAAAFVPAFFSFALPLRAQISAGIRIPVDKPDRTVGARLYGAGIEHMFSSIQGGLWGELLSNRKLMPVKDAESALPAPWFPFGDKGTVVELDAPKQATQ